jgi:uncharacterized protein YdbL (DUF1318 family)
MKIRPSVVFFLAVVFVVSCVTVNIYFPAAEVQKAADRIVEDVRGEKGPAGEEPAKGTDKGSGLFQRLRRLGAGASAAYAAEVDVNVSTPAIRALKASMKERFPRLRPFYQKGSIGENNKGLVEVRDTSGLNLRDKAELNRLVAEENKDRMDLYAEIVKANNFGSEYVPRVQEIFANSWRDKAGQGWWIQKDDGTWVRK